MRSNRGGEETSMQNTFKWMIWGLFWWEIEQTIINNALSGPRSKNISMKGCFHAENTWERKKKLNAFFFLIFQHWTEITHHISTNGSWFQSAFYYWLLRKTIGGSTPTSCNKRSDLHVFLVQVSARHGTRWTSCSWQFVFHGSCTHLFNVLPALPPKLTRTDLRLPTARGTWYEQPNKPRSDVVSNVLHSDSLKAGSVA